MWLMKTSGKYTKTTIPIDIPVMFCYTTNVVKGNFKIKISRANKLEKSHLINHFHGKDEVSGSIPDDGSNRNYLSVVTD